MTNFWSKIACGDRNKLSFLMYSLCKQRYENGLPSSDWIVNLASMLDSYGINSIPNEELYVKAAVKHMQIHIKNEYIDNWETQVNNSPKCSVLYKHIKLTFTREYYLNKLPYNLRLAMSKIRTCSHSLPIEAGRYAGSYKPRQDRTCNKCNSTLRGDELHFILVCQNPTLVELREKYISPYYTSEPSMVKLSELFNNRGKKLFKLARYVDEGLKLY